MNKSHSNILMLIRAALLALILIIIILSCIMSFVNHEPAEDFNGALAPVKRTLHSGAPDPILYTAEKVYQIDQTSSISEQLEELSAAVIPNWITVDIIPDDCNSRRLLNLEDINGVVVHYTANPGISAENNRMYYDNEDCEVNSHFIVGLEGEIIMCVPLDEQSVASNDRNRDTFSIEVCHPDESGEFNPVTYKSLTRLVAWLCALCDFEIDDVIRHYDVNGKECPYYFTQNPDAWEQFKKDVAITLYTEYRHSLSE